MTAHENLIGRRFGRLLVTSQATTNARNMRRWWVLCDCGQKTIVESSHLNNGAVKSCGCLRRENGTKYFKRLRNIAIKAVSQTEIVGIK